MKRVKSELRVEIVGSTRGGGKVFHPAHMQVLFIHIPHA